MDTRRRVWFGASFVVLLVLSSPASGAAPSNAGQSPRPPQEKDEDQPESELQRQLELKGCGPKEVKHWAKTDKAKHAAPIVPADQALIYVIRPTKYGHKIQTKLAVDGEWKGVNRGNNYFHFTLNPGEHVFCSQAENRSVLSMTVEAGKTYYLQQRIRTGWNKARNRLEVLDEQEGARGAAKCHLSLSGPKNGR